MVFKVKQNFLKTWLCIPCEQSGRNRGIPSDLSDKCKLQSCRKSEKKRENKFEKKNRFLLFLHQFLIMTWQEDLSICCCKIQKCIWVCYVDSFFRNKSFMLDEIWPSKMLQKISYFWNSTKTVSCSFFIFHFVLLYFFP